TLRTWTVSPSSLSEVGQSLLQQTLRGHGNAIVDAAIWNDSAGKETRLLTASADGSARLWQPDQYAEVVSVGGEALENEEGAYGQVLSMSVGGDKTDRIMAVARDGVATIWNLSEKNRQIRLSEGHRFLTQSAVFLKDWLITVSFDGTAVVWDTKTRAMFERW